MLPAHVALPMHLPGIFYTGVKVRIPLAICNQKYDNCNLAAEVRTLGRIVTFSSFWFCYKHPNLSIDLSHKHKNDLCIPAPRYLLAGSPKNMNQPLELQLGLLGPANSAHPRSQSNRICTLPGLYTYIYIFIYLFTLHTSATSAAGVSAGVSAFTYRHNNFHYCRSLSSCLKKSSQVLPAHVALPMHLPVIFHTAVKVQIPFAIKNICNLAEVGTLGPIVFVFQLSVLLQAPKHLRQTGSNCIPVFILLEHALASLFCWCFGLHLSID